MFMSCILICLLQEINTSTTTSDLVSDDKDDEVNNSKKKFEKVAVTWP